MFYDKKIRYLNYFKNGERIKSVGFAKIEVQDKEFKIEISLKGILCADVANIDVFIGGDAQEVLLGQLAIKNGCGEFCYRCGMNGGIGEAKLPYERMNQIRIPLSEYAEVRGEWRVDIGGVQPEKKEIIVAEKSQQEKKQEVVESMSVEKEAAEPESVKSEILEKESVEREVESETVILLEDKWRQLVSIYPHIKPFRDEREYLSVGPADFVIFSGDSYREANNSFLLHGYYNYRHLILTRVERRGEILYYVGVPGNYFDREKQVAVMFGFESFECAEEPAQKGDFGYYMMRVKL